VNIARTLGIRALTLFGVLVAVLVLLVVSLGATGYSD
jgi:peptide/nickel transport system permease protein